MTDALTHALVWLNTVANALGSLLAPAGWVPGWVSATVIAVLTGIVMLLAFKHTSNQRAIKRVRRDIWASLLAVWLFQDNLGVALRSQARILYASLKLLLLAIVPMLVMIVPTVLLMTQLALWYQARPLRVGEEAVVVLALSGEPDSPWPTVELAPNDAVEDLSGPVRVTSQREVCWNLRGKSSGLHRLTFKVNGEAVEKEFAIGDGYLPVSLRRPEWKWSDVLLHPREAAFRRGDAVRSIEIEYPSRPSWVSGTDYWVFYWFAVSLLAGFALRRTLNVNI